VFYRYEELQADALQADRYQRAVAIAAGLPDAEIRAIEHRVVDLYLPNMDEVVQGDMSRNGFTVYLGGFDWVTFVAPPHLLSRFPEFLPLPQQTAVPEEMSEEAPGEGEVPPPPEE
jgi:hypothetical protein